MKNRRGEIVAALAVAAAAILTFPFDALPLGAGGIDFSWQWILNAAAGNHWVFGRDIVFTYGPLGWLATPQDAGAHLLLANAFRAALQILLIGSTLRLLARFRRPLPIIIFSTLWVLAAAVGLRFEGLVFLGTAILVITALRTERTWPLIAAGVVVGISLFVKTSLGIATGATLAAGLLPITRRSGFGAPVAGILAAIVTAVVTGAALFPTFGDFTRWVGLALEVVDGYPAAASIVGPRSALICGSLLLIAVIICGVVAARRNPAFGASVLILAPGLLVAFRLAFVRQDGHQYLFVPYIVALLGVAALDSGRRVAPSLLGGGLAAIIAGVLSGALPFGPARLPGILLQGFQGPANISRLIQFGQTRRDLARQSRKNLEILKLPESWTRPMRTAPAGMTVVPWEMMYAPANDLPFQPLRSMQLYSAYTPRLDHITAEQFSGPGAPEYVLDDFAPVGKRRMPLDAPATWRTVFLNYRLVRFDPDRALLLLRRRSEPMRHQWREAGRTSLEVGSPGAPVPPAHGMIFAEIEAPLNLLGRLNKAFFRVPLLMAVFHREGVEPTGTRLIPAVAGAGVLVGRFPASLEDYVGLWSGRMPSPVVRLQITGPGERFYSPKFSVRWRELIIEPDPVSPATP